MKISVECRWCIHYIPSINGKKAHCGAYEIPAPFVKDCAKYINADFAEQLEEQAVLQRKYLTILNDNESSLA